jgi:cell shape-determining protein MreC
MMGICSELWRARIGNFSACSVKCNIKFNLLHLIRGLPHGMRVRSLLLITTLLVISGIELNRGPITIDELATMMNNRFDTIQTSFNSRIDLIQSSVDNVSSSLNETKNELVKINAEVKNNVTEIANLKRANIALKNQLDNMDRKSRRKNTFLYFSNSSIWREIKKTTPIS